MYKSGIKLGILGGGQLGRMFIQNALNYDLEIHVLENDINAPSSKIADSFVCGDIKDFNTVMQFGKDLDIITIEIENVNVDALFELEKKGVKVFPQAHVIKLIQDKGTQKEFYRNNNIPTAPFKLLEENCGNEILLKEIPFVQKMRTGGYDGKGVQVIKKADEISRSFKTASVVEELINFEKEISVIVVRNESGEIKTFPTVEMEFNPQANLVEFLFSPAEISTELEVEAKKIATDLIQKLGMIGVLAVEMFVTKSQEILVNEIAPRPHNSGHQTIEGNFSSQYEQHLRAILNLPLGETQIILPSVMINLLGSENHEGAVRYEGIDKVMEIPGVYIHLYGKKTTKPYRKMGHITVVNKSLDEAKKIALKVKDLIHVKAW